jgi:hypothetical protein
VTRFDELREALVREYGAMKEKLAAAIEVATEFTKRGDL